MTHQTSLCSDLYGCFFVLCVVVFKGCDSNFEVNIFQILEVALAKIESVFENHVF